MQRKKIIVGQEAKVSPDGSDDGLDRGQQVLHGNLTLTALLIEGVLPRHVGVCCVRQRRIILPVQ